MSAKRSSEASAWRTSSSVQRGGRGPVTKCERVIRSLTPPRGASRAWHPTRTLWPRVPRFSLSGSGLQPLKNAFPDVRVGLRLPSQVHLFAKNEGVGGQQGLAHHVAGPLAFVGLETLRVGDAGRRRRARGGADKERDVEHHGGAGQGSRSLLWPAGREKPRAFNGSAALRWTGRRGVNWPALKTERSELWTLRSALTLRAPARTPLDANTALIRGVTDSPQRRAQGLAAIQEIGLAMEGDPGDPHKDKFTERSCISIGAGDQNMSNLWNRWGVGSLAGAGLLAGLVACGSSSSDGAAAGSDGGGTGGQGTGGSGASSGTGGSGGGCAGSCDDGFNCTIDACVSGKCANSIGPNTGATACPPGRYCTVDKGCIASPACASTADCEKAFEGDACKTNIKCDPASSVCLFDTLDKDHDGHAPQVCGGDDCDDSVATIHPGASESCDGKDEDCNGVVDDSPTADKWCQANEGVGYVCQSGSCACKPENLCGSSCVDRMTDVNHCGTCDTKCTSGETCAAGICGCPGSTSQCGNLCADLSSDSNNCGTCGHACLTNGVCGGGTCSCPSNWSACGADCVLLGEDEQNCGTCGHACPNGAYCAASTCTCPNGQEVCGSTCKDTSADQENCGSCGNVCPLGASCSQGSCTCPYPWTTVCSNVCVSLDDDIANCGTCGAVCGAANAAPTCVTSVCQLNCIVGFADCNGHAADGCETNTDNDALNCGICGHSCAGTSCSSGACQPAVIVSGLDHPRGLAVDASRLFWTTSVSSGTVMSAPLAGGNPTILAQNQNYPMGIAVDSTTVFWGTASSIAKVAKNGGSVTTLANERGDKIAVDGANVYWIKIQYPNGAVQSVPVDGGSVSTFYTSSTDTPAGVATNGTDVFWASSGMAYGGGGYYPSTVNKIPVGGGSLVELNNLAGCCSVFDLAIDSSSVYYVGQGHGSTTNGWLRSVQQDGSGDVLLGLVDPSPKALAVDDCCVYGTAGGASQNEGVVFRVPKTGGTVDIMANHQNSPRAIVVDASYLYWINEGDGTIVRSPKK